MRAYLDNNATTPLAPEVVEVMSRQFAEVSGNPSSIHSVGRAARRVLDDARDSVAENLGCQPREIVFTGSGSEADTIAIVGSFLALRDQGDHIVISEVEHPAVLRAAQFCQASLGARVTQVPVDGEGAVSVDAVRDALEPSTVLVSLMATNNEVGTIMPTDDVGRLCRERGIRFHTDAVQAVGRRTVDFSSWPVDLLSLSCHKFHGPKGVGALVIRRGTKVLPVVQGGGQERGLRAGTENVAGIAGLAEALDLACHALRDGVMDRVSKQRDDLQERLLASIEDTVVNGTLDPARRSPNTLHLSFLRAEAEGVLMGLDREGICASSGSACSSGSTEPSHVLRAMNLDESRLASSLRISLSRFTTDEELALVAEVLPVIVQRVRG